MTLAWKHVKKGVCMYHYSRFLTLLSLVASIMLISSGNAFAEDKPLTYSQTLADVRMLAEARALEINASTSDYTISVLGNEDAAELIKLNGLPEADPDLVDWLSAVLNNSNAKALLFETAHVSNDTWMLVLAPNELPWSLSATTDLGVSFFVDLVSPVGNDDSECEWGEKGWPDNPDISGCFCSPWWCSKGTCTVRCPEPVDSYIHDNTSINDLNFGTTLPNLWQIKK